MHDQAKAAPVRGGFFIFGIGLRCHLNPKIDLLAQTCVPLNPSYNSSMALRSLLSRPLASYVTASVRKDAGKAVDAQEKIFRELVGKGRLTIFGKAHRFHEIRDHRDFISHVPIAGYEDFHPLVERISSGEKNILWPGLPIYFAKTSGTTSGTKYIPITKDSIPNHIRSARNALLLYMDRTKNYAFADHGMIFLQGSPVLDKKGVIPAGRLSGIAAHHVPSYLQKNRMPSWETNSIEDWETKLEKVVDETLKKRMSLISGIPSWLRMYFERLVEKTGKPVGEIFPDFSLLVYGGLNFEPYREVFKELIGRHVDTVELYPASEGFIAFQDLGPGEGMLLNANSGIFFEFIPKDQVHQKDPPRLTLKDVELGKDYAVILSSNAGLWAYDLGDLVRFVSVEPYRVIVSGRTSQFISAFGEHVIASEVEESLAEACRRTGVQVDEFTVAPVVKPEKGLPHHQWLMEFKTKPRDLEDFARVIDSEMCKRNPYYKDLVSGHIIAPLRIYPLPKGTFKKYLSETGKLGGQNKVVHISDNREMAEALLRLLIADL